MRARQSPIGPALLAAPLLAVVLAPLVAALAQTSPGAVGATLLDGRYLGLLASSALVAGVAAATATALGLPLGILTTRIAFPGRRIVAALMIGPILVPPVLTTVAWTFALGADASKAILYNRIAGGALLGAGLLSLVAVPVAMTLDRIDPRLLEVARVGAGTRRTERRIIAGVIAGPTLVGALLAFALACTEHASLSFVFVDQVAAAEVAVRMGGEFDRAGAAAAAAPIVALAALAILASRFASARGAAAAQDPGGHARAPQPERRGALVAIGALILSFALLAPGLLLPVGYLLKLALSADGALGRAIELGGDQLRSSVVVAACAATGATLLAGLAAAGLLRAPRWLAAPVETIAILPLGVAGAVTATGMIALWNRSGPAWLPDAVRPHVVYDSLAILVHAGIARFAPIALIVIVAGLRRTDPQLYEAASTCGMGALGRARHIGLRTAWPALLAAWLLVFALAAGEVSANDVLRPPGRDTLPLLLFNLLHFGRDADVAAMALLLLGVVLAPLVVLMPLATMLRRVGQPRRVVG